MIPNPGNLPSPSLAGSLASRVGPTSLLLTALLLSLTTHAAPPPLDPLIQQLASDSWKDRTQATEKLIAIGEDALPRLRELAARTTDDEVRARADAAIAQIEENRLVGPTPITLDLQNVPPQKALAELARLARAPIPTEPADLFASASAKPVSLKADRRPFWEVMQQFCSQTSSAPASLTRHGREAGLALQRDEDDFADARTVVAGPLLIRADRLMRNASLPFADPANATSEFTLSLTAFAEPKLRILDYSGGMKIDEAVDENGNSLIPTDPEGQIANQEVMGNGGGGNPAQFDVGTTLHYPKKNPGRRIVRLRASTTIEVQIRAARLELPIQSARNVSKTVDGVRLSIRSVDSQRADLSIFRDGRSDADWYRLRTQLFAAEAQLVDDKGQMIARSQAGVDADASDDDQRVDVKLRFLRDGEEPTPLRELRRRGPDPKPPVTKGETGPEPAKFVWEFPVETREVVVPFVFHDLPIPR